MLHRFTPGQNGHRKLGIGRKKWKACALQKVSRPRPGDFKASRLLDVTKHATKQRVRKFSTPSSLSSHKYQESENSVCPANAVENTKHLSRLEFTHAHLCIIFSTTATLAGSGGLGEFNCLNCYQNQKPQ